MSTYSHEHHIRAPQQSILELMKTFFQGQDCQFFEISPLPQDKEGRESLMEAFYHEASSYFHYLVSPTDAQGWTMIWGDYKETERTVP